MRRISIISMMWAVSFIAIGLAALRNANDAWACAIVVSTLVILGIAALKAFHRRRRERSWWFGFALFGSLYSLIAFGPLFPEFGPFLPMSLLTQYLQQQILLDNQELQQQSLIYLQEQLIKNQEQVAIETQQHVALQRRLKESLATLEEEHRSNRAMRGRLIRELDTTDDQFVDESKPSVSQEVDKPEPSVTPSEKAIRPARVVQLTSVQRARKRLRQILPGAEQANAFSLIGHSLSALLAGVLGAVISSRLYREQAVPDGLTEPS